MRLRYRHGNEVRWQLELQKWHLAVAAGALALLIAFAVWLFVPFWGLAGQFAGRGADRRPSRLYGAPLVLEAGDRGDLDATVRELERLGYHAVATGALLPGDYRRTGDGLAVYLRAFPTPQGWVGAHSLEVRVRGGTVRALRAAGKSVPRAQLEPPLVGSFYTAEVKERRPVRLEEVPEELVLCILAAEDASFFEHGGISLRGIARAAYVNLKSGAIRQGGSTLTQQLVWNLFLTHERTFSRKAREAVLALLVDLRYSKRQILEAYINEIYLGAASSGVNLMGVGSASWAYYGKEPSRLSLAEAATLAGMIPSPARYDPVKHAEAAKLRRDFVLDRLGELGWIDKARLDAARAEPIAASPQPIPRRRAAYFTDLAVREAADRFAVTDLADKGYALLSTLSAADQKAAEGAVPWGLAALEKGWEKGRKGRRPLQAALVSIDPATGGIRAYVGGRDYQGSQFDRAGARRQPGSAFKPFVYAAALRSGVVTPATMVEDAPLTMEIPGASVWSPENSDRQFRGWVSVRTAIEQSLNLPTVRVAMRTGLPQIVALAKAMGAQGSLQPVPSMALGAFEVTPLELATMYAGFAAGGVRPTAHALEGVLSPEGKAVAGSPLSPPVRALEPEVAYVVTALLQGVLQHGTGAGVHRYGLDDPLAGKTGTSNDAKDSWLAGYAPNRTTVVWVGYDENLATRLGGARGALPIWAKFMEDVRPRGGYSGFVRPKGVAAAVVDPTTGQLATYSCPYTTTEIFVARFAPHDVCARHSGYWSEPVAQPGEVDPDRARRHGGFRGFLDRVFGRERSDGGGGTDGGEGEDDGSGDDGGDGDGGDGGAPRPPR
jgi:penicillin-binding protein 1B